MGQRWKIMPFIIRLFEFNSSHDYFEGDKITYMTYIIIFYIFWGHNTDLFLTRVGYELTHLGSYLRWKMQRKSETIWIDLNALNFIARSLFSNSTYHVTTFIEIYDNINDFQPKSQSP